jgi:hypothetical protein
MKSALVNSTLLDHPLKATYSGGGTVDFQEFVGGLSAFSSRGGREEKLKCVYILMLCLTIKLTRYASRFQGLRHGSRRLYLKRRAVSRT